MKPLFIIAADNILETTVVVEMLIMLLIFSIKTDFCFMV